VDAAADQSVDVPAVPDAFPEASLAADARPDVPSPDVIPDATPGVLVVWTPSSAPARAWTSVASSVDGAKLVAVAGGGSYYSVADTPACICTSVDSGATWTQTSAPLQTVGVWTSVASSADGTRLVAVTGGYYTIGYIYTSSDSGATWTQTSAPLQSWTSVASSADGTKLVAVCYGGYIYVSADSGATWTQMTRTPHNWTSVASSADGAKLVAATGTYYSTGSAARNVLTGGGDIYTSADSGATWTVALQTEDSWTSVASSADGTKLVAAGLDSGAVAIFGDIYTSSNSGATWAQASAPSQTWTSVASSADGTKLVAVAGAYYGNMSTGYIYTSSDSGATWTQTSAPLQTWTSVASSADGTKLVAVDSPAFSPGSIYTSH
jgi:hypothetical protein